MGLIKWLLAFRKPKKIKLGLALGSGGAKGFAELGALKAFEEHGIEFSFIGGTSIGSIVGAFYADGYSATDITQMLKGINLFEVMGGIPFGMDGLGFKKVVEREIGEKQIQELKKPFICVATRASDGAEMLFNSGNVAERLCASSSFPPFFKSVIIDGESYIDGAFSNSIPADHVKALGADYVVGIDLSERESKGGLMSKLMPSYKLGAKEPWEKGYANCNVMIRPDLSGYKATSFSKAEEMFDIGYNHANSVIPQILEDIKNFKYKKKRKQKV